LRESGNDRRRSFARNATSRNSPCSRRKAIDEDRFAQQLKESKGQKNVGYAAKPSASETIETDSHNYLIVKAPAVMSSKLGIRAGVPSEKPGFIDAVAANARFLGIFSRVAGRPGAALFIGRAVLNRAEN
jgi:hypothetical protein